MTWPASISFDKSLLSTTDQYVHRIRTETLALMEDVGAMIGALGAAGGIPELDGAGLIPYAQLPVVPVSKGGTGASDAATARFNLGLTPFEPGVSLEDLGPVTISHAADRDLLTLESGVDNDGPIELVVNRTRPMGADDDAVFDIKASASDDEGDPVWLTTVRSELEDASAGSVTSSLRFMTRTGGIVTERLRIGGPRALTIYGDASVEGDLDAAGVIHAGVPSLSAGLALQCHGNLLVGGSTHAGYIAFQSSSLSGPITTNWGRIQCDSNGLSFHTNKTGSGTTDKLTISREGDVHIVADSGSSGRLGVGIAPAARLHTYNPSGTYGSSNPLLRLQYASGNIYDWYTDGSSNLVLSLPVSKGLTISGNSANWSALNLDNANTNWGSEVNWLFGGSSFQMIKGGISYTGEPGPIGGFPHGTKYFTHRAAAHTWTDLTASAEWMRLYGGNLGIGTGGNPSARLHAVGASDLCRLGYDLANYARLDVAGDGQLTIVTEGSDPDLQIGTKNLAGAITVDDSAGTIGFTQTNEQQTIGRFRFGQNASGAVATLGIANVNGGATSGAGVILKIGNTGGFARDGVYLKALRTGAQGWDHTNASTQNADAVLEVARGAALTEVFRATSDSDFYFRYDGSNHLRLGVAPGGAATLETFGIDSDLRLSTPGMPSALHLDESSRSVFVNGNQLIVENSNLYLRNGAANSALFQVQGDGELYMALTGSDADFALTVGGMYQAIRIDQSAGQIGLNGNVHIAGELLSVQPAGASYLSASVNGGESRIACHTFYKLTTDGAAQQALSLGTMGIDEGWFVTVKAGYSENGAPPYVYGTIVHNAFVARNSYGGTVLVSNEVSGSKTGGATAISVTYSGGAVIVNVTGVAGRSLHWGGEIEVIKTGI